jgi:RIO kinase 2
MSFAENAVQVFRLLRSEDLRVLQVVETAMSKREFVPKEQIVKFAALPSDRVTFALAELDKLGLIRQMRRPYLGYTLNYVGYDCLAINTLVKAGLIEEFGHKLGVGKEADVYDALTSEGGRVAVKFHRLGRPSFRQTRRKRGYAAERVGWLFQSRLAAEKEYGIMRLVYSVGVAVPEPLGQNRHLVVMGMIEGGELARWKNLVSPVRVLRRVMLNVRKAYLKAGVVHADLSEYNIIVVPNMKILIIDWPQAVRRDHPNAGELLARDVSCVLRFFARRFGISAEFGGVLDYVTGKTRGFESST